MYSKRIVDEIISKKLLSKGAILVQGLKWCGKTTTAKQHASSAIYIDDPIERDTYMHLAEMDMKSLLDGPTPRLIDEWQLAPRIWDGVRYEVDHRQKFGQFILTGSAVPADKAQIMHTGTGRFAWVTMRTMTLMESGESSAEVSLRLLFDQEGCCSGSSSLTLSDVVAIASRGGWPQAISLPPEAAKEAAYDYIDAVAASDLSRVDGVARNAAYARKVLRAYARHQGTQASMGTLLADVADGSAASSEKTLASYINAMREIFLIEDMPAWNPNLRSKAAIRTSPTRYFADPSIAVAALQAGANDLMRDLETLGLIFETMCARDLRVYAQTLGGDVYHYRDSNGLECDAVVHLRDGRYGLAEIKLGGEKQIADAQATLNKLAANIDTGRMGEPSFKMVITAVGSHAYKLADGTCVVPIGALGA